MIPCYARLGPLMYSLLSLSFDIIRGFILLVLRLLSINVHEVDFTLGSSLIFAMYMLNIHIESEVIPFLGFIYLLIALVFVLYLKP